MGGMKDLLGDEPYQPGFKENETSREAANRFSPLARRLQREALDVIERSAGMTADEVAAALGASVLAIRPRISELYLMGKIEKSGVRRENESGISAHVWRATKGEARG